MKIKHIPGAIKEFDIKMPKLDFLKVSKKNLIRVSVLSVVGLSGYAVYEPMLEILPTYLPNVAQPTVNSHKIFLDKHKDVVSIEAGGALGTGVRLKNGVILTAAHVVDGEKHIQVMGSGDKTTKIVKGIKTIAGLDLALLYLETPAPVSVPVKNSKKLKKKQEKEVVAPVDLIAGITMGQPVYTLGFPSGQPLRSVEGTAVFQSGDGNTLLEGSSFYPGMSGGPNYDGKGRLVGITTKMVMTSKSLTRALQSADGLFTEKDQNGNVVRSIGNIDQNLSHKYNIVVGMIQTLDRLPELEAQPMVDPQTVVPPKLDLLAMFGLR